MLINGRNDYQDELPQFMDYLWGVPVRYHVENGELVGIRHDLPVVIGPPPGGHVWRYERFALYRFYTNFIAREFVYNQPGLLFSSAKRLGVERRPPGLPFGSRAELRKVLQVKDRRAIQKIVKNAPAILSEMRSLTRRSGAAFAVMTHAQAKELDEFEPDVRTGLIIRYLGLDHLDLAPGLLTHATAERTAFQELTYYENANNGHLNVAGNHVVGDLICDWLETSELVARKKRPDASPPRTVDAPVPRADRVNASRAAPG